MLAHPVVYADELEPLNRNITLPDRVRAIHQIVSERFDGIDRIEAAFTDPKPDLAKTFVDSSDSHPSHHDFPVRVLIADDNADLTKSLAILLQDWRFEAVQAYDGTAAMAPLRDPESPTLALL